MSIGKTIILALILRLLIAPFFYHPDLKSQNFHFQFLSHGVLNIYQYIADNKSNLPYRDTFNYLPLTYFTFGSIHLLEKPFQAPGFYSWLNDWGENQNSSANFPYFLLVLKIPYIILDFSIAYLLFKITRSKYTLNLWLFNPISLYLIYVLGNFDVLPVFLTLLSFYWLKTNPIKSFLVFGIAIALKLYPLLFLPFFLIHYSHKPSDWLKYSLLSLTPLLISILPFIQSTAFWQSFFGSGLTQKIFELKIFSFPIFPILYLFLLIFYLLKTKLNIIYYLFFVFLLFVSFVNFHPQWILWFFPFLFLEKKIVQKYLILIPVFILIFAYISLFNDNFLFWGHLLPIDSEFILVSSPYNLVRYRFLIDPHQIQNYLKIALGSIAVLSFIFYEKKSTHN
jgi:hypothetical protein